MNQSLPKAKKKLIINLKFGDGDGPNLCRVTKQMLVPHLLKNKLEIRIIYYQYNSFLKLKTLQLSYYGQGVAIH